jgi:hypothetical protein
MATLDEIVQERQRISERLTQLDAERTKLSDQLNDLVTAERVMTRFGGKADTTKGWKTEHSAGTTPATPGEHRAEGGQQAPGVLLSDASLKAVRAYRKGATSNDVLRYLSRRFGMTVRPNHLGIALQRHRRAGRLENRDQRWYLPSSVRSEH